MRNTFSKIKISLIFIVFIFLNHSCIMDEFKIGEIDIIHMKDDWGMDIVSPLFSGKFDFKDLIYDEDSVHFRPNVKYSMLKFPDNRIISIPSSMIFEPATIIDSLHFLIGGNYSLKSIRLEYSVSNGCPFPLNLKMRYFNDEDPGQFGPPILPDAFLAAEPNGTKFNPIESTQSVTLNEEQSLSFTTGNRIEISTWFNYSDLIHQQDTFLSNYPVEISIVLYGVIKRAYD